MERSTAPLSTPIDKRLRKHENALNTS